MGDVRTSSPSVRAGSIAAHYKQDSIVTPQVPTVRVTLPGEEDLKIERKEHCQHDSAPKSNYDGSSALFQDTPLHSQVARTTLRPRRYHLTTDSVSYSHQVRASKGGILKHKKDLHQNLPVFSERTIAFLNNLVLDTSSSSQDGAVLKATAQHNNAIPVEPEPPVKRPNASAVEKQWRTQTWQKPPQTLTADASPPRSQGEEDFLATQREYETLKLAAELQKFALQQTREDAISTPLERQAKVKPKPQSGRHSHRQDHHDMLDCHVTGGNREDETEWIVETYVREPNPAPANDVSSSVMPSHAPAGDFGLLVIPEEDEPAWEVFGEEEGGDSDLSSDGSDSNGEVPSFFREPSKC